MFVLRTEDGLYYRQRYEFTEDVTEAKRFGTPESARRKHAKIAGEMPMYLTIVPIAGSMPKPVKAEPTNGEPKKARGRKKRVPADETDLLDS